jgi:hypothetical protein
MSRSKLAVVALILIPSVASAQKFDWSAQLKKTPVELNAAIGRSGTCVGAGHSVPVTFVDSDTTTAPDLFDPVVNTGSMVVLIRPVDPSVDRDEERRYVADGIGKLTCTIGREATATAYSFENRIFRIQLDFDRCETREEQTHSILGTPNKPFVYSPCRGSDTKEKDFDASLYHSIKARNTYGYTRQGQPGLFDFQWSRFMGGEYEPAERKYVAYFRCSGGEQMERLIAKRSHKCLIDVDNADASHWSATAMYEFSDHPGVIWNEVSSRLTSKRLFVDMPAEQQAAKSMLPGLRAMVDDSKRKIARRIAAKESNENAVSNILGAGK